VTVEILPPDHLRSRPKSALDDELREHLREHKPEIIAIISAKPATCCAACYEIEPNKWIHHPERGCTTKVTVSVVDGPALVGG
jgi:hypothetical protein